MKKKTVRLKRLKVHQFPQGNCYVPAIRVAGNWLKEAGFELGDTVTLEASRERIELKRARR